jgi:nicotinamide-nucleotide amidase
MKMKWLNVKQETLDAYGAVSEQTALEMAKGIRNATGADFGLSTTGIAGPGGGSEEKPVGLVYMAVAGENYERVEKVIIRYGERTSREMIRQRSAKHALHLLLQAVKTKA